MMRKKFTFYIIISDLIIILITLIMFEFFSSKTVPPFPKYLTKPSRWKYSGLNSMGFLDKERSFKNVDNNIRVLFIGDSFLEIYDSSIVPECEELVKESIKKDIEFINLGESDSDPVDYYWGLKNIGMHFMPELITVFIFEGNDFIAETRLKKGINPNCLIAIYPQQSIFSNFFPKTTSFLTAMYYYVRGLFVHKPWIEPDEWMVLSDQEKELKLIELISKKARVSIDRANQYVKSLSAATKKFIFNGRYLPGYYLDHVVNCVFLGNKLQRSFKAEQTIKCIIEMKRLLLEKRLHCKINVFFIPAAEKVDPDFLNVFQDLFKTKGLPFGPLLDDKEYERFSKSLMTEGIEVFNLSEALNGIGGSYSLDGHWSKLGMKLVSQYVSKKLSTALSLK